MSIKKHVPYIVVFAALFLTFAFSGCNEESNLVSQNSVENFSSPDFAILDFDDAMNSLDFATFDDDMTFGDFPPPGYRIGGFVTGWSRSKTAIRWRRRDAAWNGKQTSRQRYAGSRY